MYAGRSYVCSGSGSSSSMCAMMWRAYGVRWLGVRVSMELVSWWSA